MTELRARFANAAAFFWQHPVLWLPVIAADLCKFVFAQADAALRHAVIVWSLPKSVLGGYGGGTSLPIAPIVLASLLRGLAFAFDLFCYLYAFAILASSVPRAQQGKRTGRFFLNALPKRFWQTLAWCALAWISLALSSVFSIWLHRVTTEALLLFALIILVPATYLLTPVLLSYARANSGTNLPHASDSVTDACFSFFAVLVASGGDYVFMQATKQDPYLGQLATHAVPWFWLSCGVSLLTSLPYAFAMIGLTLCELPPGLFVYGTLHPDRAPVEIREQARQLVWRSEGSTSGRLQDLGDYPALLPSNAGETVEGSVFYLPHGEEALLAAFDAYEGYDPASPDTSQFLRELRPVLFLDGHTEQHWVYVYNREVSAAE